MLGKTPVSAQHSFQYKAELTLKWDDPEVRIEWPHGLWPTSGPVLSEGDRSGIRLSEFEDGVLPRYDAT